MKKLIGVIAILLTLVLSVIYRQLAGNSGRAGRQKISVPSVVQENLFLASLVIQ